MWPGDGDEVGAERLHVEADVRRGLGGVAGEDRAALVRPVGEPAGVGDRAERVRDDVRGDDLHVLEVGDRVEQQVAVVVDRDDPEVGAGAVRDVLPGDEVRVVLELGREHDVARPSRASP